MSIEDLVIDHLYNNLPAETTEPTMLTPEDGEILDYGVPSQYETVLEVARGYEIETPLEAADQFNENILNPIEDRQAYLFYLKDEATAMSENAGKALSALEKEIDSGNLILTQEIQELQKDLTLFQEKMNRISASINDFAENKNRTLSEYNQAMELYYRDISRVQINKEDSALYIAQALSTRA